MLQFVYIHMYIHIKQILYNQSPTWGFARGEKTCHKECVFHVIASQRMRVPCYSPTKQTSLSVKSPTCLLGVLFDLLRVVC